MVKNFGGKKAKRLGRKHVQEAAEAALVKCRLKDPALSGERYAVVCRLLGGDMCEVLETSGARRVCVIRKRFRGRNKRDHMVAAGGLVLVGLREWEARPKCDLLEVYSGGDLARIASEQPAEIAPLLPSLSESLFCDDGDAAAAEAATVEYAAELPSSPSASESSLDDGDVDIDAI